MKRYEFEVASADGCRAWQTGCRLIGANGKVVEGVVTIDRALATERERFDGVGSWWWQNPRLGGIGT